MEDNRKYLDKIARVELEFEAKLAELRKELESSKGELNRLEIQEDKESQPDHSDGTRSKHFQKLRDWREKHRNEVQIGLKVLAWIAFLVYCSYAFYYRFGDDGSVRLLVLLIFVILKTFSGLYWSKWGKFQMRDLRVKMKIVTGRQKVIRFVIFLAILAAILIYVLVEVGLQNPSNLVSLSGIVVFILLALVTSKNPRKVEWRIVVVGFTLQLTFALVILRTSFGVSSFQWLGDRVSEFLRHTDAGSKFIFGDGFQEHYIIFAVLPTVVFCSSIISILYYLGVMQWIIIRCSAVIQHTMGTTAGESVIAVGNIFFGSAEAPLLIHPLLDKLTASELHATMTCGFATISGSVLAAYIFMEVPANHLLSASIMSAPAALAIAKLSFPELGKSVLKGREVRKNLGKSKDKSLLEAASSGAVAAIPLVAGIAVNLIAFVAILEFVDQALDWVGQRVGLMPPQFPVLSVRWICSYLLWPFAFLMGCPTPDCGKVASLLGIRAFLNEFIAYQELGTIIKNRKFIIKHNYTGATSVKGDDLILVDMNNTVLQYGVISHKSEVISTYALCGFAGCIGVGIMLGVMTGAIPSRKSEVSRYVVRAVVSGTLACYLTASIAGLLFTD